jgi:hypothetical protein
MKKASLVSVLLFLLPGATAEQFTQDNQACVQPAAAQASMARAPRQGFEQQLAQLDRLKARGRITEGRVRHDAQALVEGVTVGALTLDRPEQRAAQRGVPARPPPSRSIC